MASVACVRARLARTASVFALAAGAGQAFAQEVTQVEDIIVTGHYGCGGIAAALQGRQLGLIDNWLRHVQDIRDHHQAVLKAAGDQAVDRLCELNVLEQALNVCRTTVVQDAWRRGQQVAVHAWIYAVSDGLVRDLNFCATGEDEVAQRYAEAVAALPPPAPVQR